MEVKDAVKRAIKEIDDICDPDDSGMDKGQYKDFLEELLADLEGRYESVCEELGEED